MFRSFIATLLLATANYLSAGQIALHVSPTGRSLATGSETDPFATIEQARDRIRDLRSEGALDNTAIEVLVHSGKYFLSSTLAFTEKDSGTAETPIIYRTIDGEVLISGGAEIKDWQRLTQSDLVDRLPLHVREQIVCADMARLGIEPGAMRSQRLHQPLNAAPMEMFAELKRLPRAGWPNHGWANANKLGPVSWELVLKHQGKEPKQAWAHGFWDKDWDSSFEPIAIDVSAKTVTLNSNEVLRPKQVRDGARYRISNLLEELDSPGEWYLDEATGLLVYWPIENNSAVSVSIIDTVLSIYGTEHVTFDGFRIESARSMNVEIAGGSAVCLKNCCISQAGTVAVHIVGGSRHSVVDCDISCTGSSAVRIEGGDRKTLEACHHSVDNCHIHQFCQHYLTGRAAVAIYGVGIVLTTNHIHHGPDSAVAIHGNEHIIEHNEIAHVCSEADDSAAIHLSYDPTYRGNVIRRNYIHDLGGFSKTGVIGIYLDDFASGTTVEHNLLQNTIRGIAIGGGRDNRIENNVIRNSIAPIQMDARGLSWARDQIEGENSRISILCKSVLSESPLVSRHYPELAALFEDEPMLPKGNILRFNTFDGPRGIDLQGVDQKIVVMENNRRTTELTIARVDSTLHELGIQLHSSQTDDTRKTRRTRPTYVLTNKAEVE